MNLTSYAWLLLPLGVCRAMQILLFDRVTDPPRRWLLQRLNPHGYDVEDPRRPYFSVILSCPWCLSMYVAAAAVGFVAWDATRAGALIVLAVLAASLVAVAVDRIFDRLLPDDIRPTLTVERNGITMTGPAPEHVAEAFDAVEADR